MADELPPMTVEALVADLRNPNFKGYVYIGNAGDPAWNVAKGAQKMLAGVRVYLANPTVADAVRDQFGVGPGVAGIVFGWELDIHATLTPGETKDFLTVAQAIQDA